MKRSLKLSEILGESKFKKVNVLQLLAFAIGGSATFLAYMLTDLYIDQATIIGIFIALQILIALVLNKANPIGSTEITVNRFLMAFFLPVTLAPLACIHVDRFHADKIENVRGIVEEKRIKKGGGKYSRRERRILTIRTAKETNEESVLRSFYDLVDIGDSVGVDFEKCLLGFRKSSDFSSLFESP